ncbi:MAG: hypothetical protein CFE44_17535 [Burkholderiales bacterium PBB4]|nr:MAG: hypothetical protein CFE44_17535 [Burkholderiales bacterium PBB4]
MDSAGAALVFIAVLAYFIGLSNPHAPTNGDEMVYVHIARMTAESGHWLPLQSEIVDTRNTKPPLLFWQAMLAGDWGQHWNLWALRLPSVAYTLLTTALLALFTFRISRQWKTACVAAAVYLLFFSSFRYGRVYLTSAPETFWLALPMWWVFWWRTRPDNTPPDPARHLNWVHYSGFGLAFGLGAAYKSFALIAPAAAALWCAILLSTPRLQWREACRTTLGTAWSTAIGLGIFALWFALDPDPAAVWQEFIVAENAGKMSTGQGYWQAALFGAYPMWTQLFAYPENAGLLFFVAIGAIVGVLRPALRKSSYGQLRAHHWILITWLLVWLVVFTLPSQRSARYMIPAMPALAITIALLWQHIHRAWFSVTLLLMAPILLMLARIGWTMGTLGIASVSQVTAVCVAAGISLGVVATGLLFKAWTRYCTLASVLAVYLVFAAMVEPLGLDGNSYPIATMRSLAAKNVAVPNGFTGQFERFHFVLPGARITPYDAEGRNTGAYAPELPPEQRLHYLLRNFDAVIWLQDDLSQVTPSCVPDCVMLGSRWHIKSRHKSGEISLQNLWYPDQWLFRREWLISSKMH